MAVLNYKKRHVAFKGRRTCKNIFLIFISQDSLDGVLYNVYVFFQNNNVIVGKCDPEKSML